MMRGAGLGLLLLLAACSGGAGGPAAGQPGVDVARAALRGGSPQIALQVTQGLLAKHPNDAAALLVQGDALTVLGRYDDAAVDYTAVLKQDPTSVEGHIGLGRLRLATDPAQAEALFLEALQVDPRNTTALNDLGIARDLQGHHAGAQKAYSKALGIDPELHAAQVNLALSLAMSGDSGRAVRLLQPLASEPGASRKLRHDLAAVLAMGGNRKAAARILSADLSPAEIQRALADYVAARSGGPLPPPATGRGQVAPATQAAAPAIPPASHMSGAAQVQFTAAPSEAAAQAAWQSLNARMPDLLAGRAPMIIKVVEDNQTFWRLRTGGFAGAPEAEAFCARVRAAGSPCMVYDEPNPTTGP